MSVRTRACLPFLLVGLWACDEANFLTPRGEPAPPRDLQGHYYAGAVHLSWELDPGWRDDSFRVYGKRTTDPDYFMLAEVTSCSEGVCVYTDLNIQPRISYEYFVAAVNPDTGWETSSDHAIEVFVPDPTPPPAPAEVEAVGLDGVLYLHWADAQRDADGFGFYRVYLAEGEGGSTLLGETDSEGFVDLLVQNGSTYAYFVTSVDEFGHESEGSVSVSATPRPDFHGELMYAHGDDPSRSGFRFQAAELDDPLLPGDAPDRDFRLEFDEEGWWIAPGPEAEVHPEGFSTTQLRCGPASGAFCVDLPRAPASGYSGNRVPIAVGYTFVLRMQTGEGEYLYGAIRVSHLGFAQDGALMIFDWVFQLQPENRDLAPPAP